MDALFNSETLVAKRINEWDSLFARVSAYTDSTEQLYTRKQNAQFTSLKHGFRKRFSNRKKQSRPRKLAFEVQNLDNDGSDTEVLSDDSSIYSANDELGSDISDSESVDSVQYVLQCNEQRKLPDFNTKVENCQTYMLQNACFNQGVKENNPNVYINNSSVNKNALQSEKNKVNEVSSFLEANIPTRCSPLKSVVANKDIEIRVINPVENEKILTTDQLQISNSENKQLKSILSTKVSKNSSKINKKITFSSDPDSEIDSVEFQSDDNGSINGDHSETDHLTSQNSNLSTLENTKTLSTTKISVNNEVNLNQSKLLNIQNVNNLEKVISTVKINGKSKIYSSAARKKQLSLNSDTESSMLENTVDQISEIKISKSKTTINNTLNQFLDISSKGTNIYNEYGTKLRENECVVKINQCSEQIAELRVNAICKTPSKHKQTPKNKCHIIFSTELDCSDNESSILNTNLNETYDEDTIKKKLSRINFSSSTESDSEESINHGYSDLKSNNVETGKNNENATRKEDSKNITNKELRTVYKQVDSIKSNSQVTPIIIDLTTPVKTINSVSKLKNAPPKDICKKLFTNTDTLTSLLNENSTDNSEEEHNKENRLPNEISARMKSKELNKNTEKRKSPKKIGMKIFSTETHCSESECNLVLKSKSNVLAKNKLATNNFIRKNTTKDETTNDAETKKQYLISSAPNINAIRKKSGQEQCLKENNVDDEITEVCSSDQSTIPNEAHMNNVTLINLQKNVDENPLEDNDEIFETTIKNKESGNLSRKQIEYTNNRKNIIDENTTVNDSYEDITMSDTIVNLRYNKNGAKIITDSRNNGLHISSSNAIVNEVRPNTLIKSSRKKKSRENIRESPTLSTESNSNNQSSKIIKCRQRLFNSSSENDNDNFIVQLNSAVSTKESRKAKQNELNMDKENSEDLNKDNQTHSLTETIGIINKIQNKSVNEQNSILRNHRKRKLGDSSCGSVKQMEKKQKITTNTTSKHSIEQVILNGILENSETHESNTHTMKQKSILQTAENNVKQENASSKNYDENRTSQENTHSLFSQSTKDEDNTKRNVSEKKNDKERRRKCRKEIRFIAYSTDDYTNDEDKMWSISSIKSRTRLSLEYFLDDDVF